MFFWTSGMGWTVQITKKNLPSDFIFDEIRWTKPSKIAIFFFWHQNPKRHIPCQTRENSTKMSTWVVGSRISKLIFLWILHRILRFNSYTLWRFRCFELINHTNLMGNLHYWNFWLWKTFFFETAFEKNTKKAKKCQISKLTSKICT
jgi:hypothetical protein